MSPTLFDLQESIKDKIAFGTLDHYYQIGSAYLTILDTLSPTRIIAPNDSRYIFFQYDKNFSHRITRPLNSDLFIEDEVKFNEEVARFVDFLGDLRQFGADVSTKPAIRAYLQTNAVNRMIYTIQQSVGAIGDSFDNPNQSRKRIGQLFENFIRLLLVEIGFSCDSRTISVPIPDHPDHTMSYQLDIVFSKNSAVIANESELIHPNEIVGSIKTTSKDRIDKIFLDKFLLSKLLGRDIKTVAIFLHDVQRAKRANSIFGINSTFKTNHFLGYTMALNRMDGVYYVDPRPDMVSDPRLNQEISDFQTFLTHDIWSL